MIFMFDVWKLLIYKPFFGVESFEGAYIGDGKKYTKYTRNRFQNCEDLESMFSWF